MTASVTASFSTWDTATSCDLFRYGESPTSERTALRNGENLVFWGPMTDAMVITKTTAWYTRSTKAIVEAEIQRNDDLAWGIDPDGELPAFSPGSAADDIRNIAAREAGHVCGLADLYGPRDTGLAMYGYGVECASTKISLAKGDIAGLLKLCGA